MTPPDQQVFNGAKIGHEIMTVLGTRPRFVHNKYLRIRDANRKQATNDFEFKADLTEKMPPVLYKLNESVCRY